MPTPQKSTRRELKKFPTPSHTVCSCRQCVSPIAYRFTASRLLRPLLPASCPLPPVSCFLPSPHSFPQPRHVRVPQIHQIGLFVGKGLRLFLHRFFHRIGLHIRLTHDGRAARIVQRQKRRDNFIRVAFALIVHRGKIVHRTRPQFRAKVRRTLRRFTQFFDSQTRRRRQGGAPQTLITPNTCDECIAQRGGGYARHPR